MQSDYRGYLVKFGDNPLPNKFLKEYTSTPDRRIEKKAWRDNNQDLQRVTSPNYKSTVNLVIMPLTQSEKDLFVSIISDGLVDETERKYKVTFWNLETAQYSDGFFYIPDTEYKIKHISDNETGAMFYDSFTLELIQY